MWKLIQFQCHGNSFSALSTEVTKSWGFQRHDNLSPLLPSLLHLASHDTHLYYMKPNALYSRQCSWRWCSPSGGLHPTVAAGPECDHLWGQIFKTSRSKVTFTNTRDTYNCIARPCAAIFSHACSSGVTAHFHSVSTVKDIVFTLNPEI